jgi:hypothetical protein
LTSWIFLADRCEAISGEMHDAVRTLRGQRLRQTGAVAQIARDWSRAGRLR